MSNPRKDWEAGIKPTPTEHKKAMERIARARKLVAELDALFAEAPPRAAAAPYRQHVQPDSPAAQGDYYKEDRG